MRAKEFIIEVDLSKLATTPVKGGITLGDAVAQHYKKQTGQEIDPVQALEMISAADPTPNNNLTRWLSMIYLSPNSNFIIPEDVNQIKEDLTKFMKLAKQKKLPPEQRDINKYKTLGQLYDVLEQYEEEDVQSNKEKKQQIKQEGVDFIIDDPKFAVVHTKTHEANCFYGAGTKWCTSSKDDPGYFDQYSEQGPLYTILDNSGSKPRKYQFHYESDQFLNERDEPVTEADIAQLSKNPGWQKFLNMMIKKHYGKYFKDAEKVAQQG